MKTAVVTGASSGIGRAVTERLLHLDYTVIGISRRTPELEHHRFVPFTCNLFDPHETAQLTQRLKQEPDVSLLVNAAGFGVFEPHEELDAATIEQMIQINLTVPILLSNALLRTLKQNNGMLINIASIEATRSSKFSALYTATKAGLRAFGNALFEELRNSGVGVVTINPDMTDTAFFDTLRFGVSEAPNCRLESRDIADAVEQVLSMRDGAVITEMTLRSQRFGIRKKKL